MAVRSAGESASTSARAAFRISSDSRRTLGLASITIATLADSVEASKYVSGCCTPSSNTRKSVICSPRTATPSAPITLHVTGTICVTTEIACSSVDVAPLGRIFRASSVRRASRRNRLQLPGCWIALPGDIFVEAPRPRQFCFLLSLQGKGVEGRSEKAVAPMPKRRRAPQTDESADACDVRGKSRAVASCV